MKNQQKHQSETSVEQAKIGNDVKRLQIAGFILGIIATAFVMSWLTKYYNVSSYRFSTPSEIATQEEFQDKWDIVQVKVDTATKEAKRKSDSILKGL